MSSYLSLQMVKGAAGVILNSTTVDLVNAIGCTESEWELVTGTKAWIGVDRAPVTRVLDSLLFGMIDTIGLPRFELPAEYMATIVSIFVSPVNYFSACSWLGSFISNEDLAGFTGKTEPVEGFERVKASQIFAIICAIKSEGVLNHIVDDFSRKVSLNLAYVMEVQDEKPKSKK